VKELEAVNILLSVIGEAPVDSLSDITVNEITDSALARKTLHEVARDVQAEGWSWNTDHGVKYTLDSQNQVPIPATALKVVFSGSRYGDMPYVVRGMRVYDRNRQTYDIALSAGDGPVVAEEVVTQLEWDYLPHAAQQYIVIRAARIYSDRYLNSNAIYVYTAQDEQYARSMLIRAEERNGGDNLLYGNDLGIGQGISYLPVQGLRYRSN
jgi:hypothetical protein